MNTLILEFTDYNNQNRIRILETLKSFDFIKVRESDKSIKPETEKFTDIEKIKSTYKNEWILLAEPQEKDGELMSGIILFHHCDKKQLAIANQNCKLTKQYKKATHFYTGTLPKRNSIGIFR